MPNELGIRSFQLKKNLALLVVVILHLCVMFAEILDNLRPVSPDAPASSATPQRFLKINVRHITDGQVSLLVDVALKFVCISL